MAGVLCVDEVSMLHAKFLSCLERRYTESDMLGVVKDGEDPSKIILGGMHVIFLGDMLQLPPPSNFTNAMYVDCVEETTGGIGYSKDTHLLRDVVIFRKFVKVELVTQCRAGGDKKGHVSMIHHVWTAEQPITSDIIKKLKPLTRHDIETQKWKFVTYLVTSNLDRFLINKLQVFRYVKATGRPVYTWVDRLTNAGHVDVSEEEDEVIGPTGRRFFVRGAPC